MTTVQKKDLVPGKHRPRRPPPAEPPRGDTSGDRISQTLELLQSQRDAAFQHTKAIARDPGDTHTDLDLNAKTAVILHARYQLPAPAIAEALGITEMKVRNILASPKGRKAVYAEQAAALAHAATDAIATLHAIIIDPTVRANPKALNPLTRACAIIIAAAGHAAPVKTERAPWRDPPDHNFAAGGADEALRALAPLERPLSECTDEEIAASLRKMAALMGRSRLPQIEGEGEEVSTQEGE